MIFRSRFPKAGESRLVRFVRDDRDPYAPWVLVGSLPDRELAERGALLAGPEIDRDALREVGLDDALVAIVENERLDSAERDRQLEDLLRVCPRSRYLPPIDLDVAPGHTRAEALAWARRLEPELVRDGLSAPLWHRTGGMVGVHGDLFAPVGFQHPDLLEIARFLVVKAARRIGLPLISDHVGIEGRPPVVLDDGLFRRNPERRGVVWRLSGALKPKGGIKTAIDLDDVEIDYTGEPTTPARLDAFAEAAAVVERQREIDGTRFGRKRRRRPVAPLALPASTTFLPLTAAALTRHMTPGSRHEPRLAFAGWLMGVLGVAQAIVESTLVHAGSSNDDARDAVDSTRRRLDTGSGCYGLPKLQDKLGGAACVELRNALERDGVAAARKAYWTDHERRLLMRVSRAVAYDHPGRRALTAGARCGTFSMPYECEDHGPQGVRRNVEEREITCPHCREARIASRLEVMRETLKGDRFGVLVVPCDVANPDRLRALVLARRAGKALFPFGRRRWLVGHDHVLIACDAPEIRSARDMIRRLASKAAPDRGHRAERGEGRAWRAIQDFKILPEHAREVTKAELLELMARTWRQPGVELQGLVETDDEAAVASFPWLQKTNFVRTGADKNGRSLIPWPSKKAIRERAKQKAIAARGGIDPTLCDHETGCDETGHPIPCMRPYRVHVDHVPTGMRLRDEPYIGRFPENHELHLLLEIADPEALRAGYEQQRALARRR